MSTRHHCVTVICTLIHTGCQQCLLCRTLGQGQSGPSLHREESSGSTTSFCYCQWLGAVFLHEASLPWQSPGEHNRTCTFVQTESAEKHTEYQTNFQFFLCCFGVYQFSCTFLPASSLFGKSKHQIGRCCRSQSLLNG